MARCRASVIIGQTLKPTEVIFSNSSDISYISETKAAELGVSLEEDAFITTIKGAAGGTSTCTKSASIDLILDTSRHDVRALIVPGDLPYLVLGGDWFVKHHPVRFGSKMESVSITVDHTIRLLDQDPSRQLLLPTVSVVNRTPKAERKKAKPVSRYKFIKDGWGNRVNFQASYGLSMAPDDIEEGNRILEMMQKEDEESDKGGPSNGQK